MNFRDIADEVIAHLRAGNSTRLTVRIEIEATDATGFDESKVRTISENARTLKFDQAGFEEGPAHPWLPPSVALAFFGTRLGGGVPQHGAAVAASVPV